MNTLNEKQETLAKYNQVKDIEIRYSGIVDYNYDKKCDWCGGEREYESNFRLKGGQKIFSKKLILCEDCNISFYRGKQRLERTLK